MGAGRGPRRAGRARDRAPRDLDPGDGCARRSAVLRTVAGPSSSAAALGAAALVALLAGCGGSGTGGRPAASAGRLPPDYRPVPVGHGSSFRLPALSPAAAHQQPIDELRCTRSRPAAYGIHLELYGDGLVVPIPAGIGIAPPQRRSGAYVRGGACRYRVRTYEPTGLVVVDSGRPPTLGTLFDVWGQPLSGHRLGRFRGAVAAFVGGRRWDADPRRIPLARHAEIVLESGVYVAPHPAYLFPPGL